ncbi:MAG: sulfur carrier protein ThiS [Acidimicrobiales bacterium]
MIQAVINGQVSQLPPGSTVDEVVATLFPVRSGIAVAVNRQVIARSSWRAVTIAAGDEVEVLTAAQGG